MRLSASTYEQWSSHWKRNYNNSGKKKTKDSLFISSCCLIHSYVREMCMIHFIWTNNTLWQQHVFVSLSHSPSLPLAHTHCSFNLNGFINSIWMCCACYVYHRIWCCASNCWEQMHIEFKKKKRWKKRQKSSPKRAFHSNRCFKMRDNSTYQPTHTQTQRHTTGN